MPIQTPSNEAAILPTLSAQEQESYLRSKEAMNRAVEKYPDTNPQLYTDYLSIYLKNAQQFDVTARTEDGRPLDPRFVRDRKNELQAATIKEFTLLHPVTTQSKDPAEIERVARNSRDVRRYTTERDGEGFLSSGIKSIYDEEKGGFQWPGIVGGAGGGLIGALMGMFIAGAAGGGWLGIIAVGLLTVAGTLFGAQVGERLVPSQQGAIPPSVSGSAPAQGASPDISKKLDDALASAKASMEQSDKSYTAEEQQAHAALEKSLKEFKEKPASKDSTPTISSKAIDELEAQFKQSESTLSDAEKSAVAAARQGLGEMNALLTPPATPQKPATAEQERS